MRHDYTMTVTALAKDRPRPSAEGYLFGVTERYMYIKRYTERQKQRDILQNWFCAEGIFVILIILKTAV